MYWKINLRRALELGHDPEQDSLHSYWKTTRRKETNGKKKKKKKEILWEEKWKLKTFCLLSCTKPK
jgi:hypothetical protein